MELDAIKAHKDALAQHIATWLLDFTTKTGVPLSVTVEAVMGLDTDANGQLKTTVEKYNVSLTGVV
jgi:hypothetical protein